MKKIVILLASLIILFLGLYLKINFNNSSNEMIKLISYQDKKVINEEILIKDEIIIPIPTPILMEENISISLPVEEKNINTSIEENIEEDTSTAENYVEEENIIVEENYDEETPSMTYLGDWMTSAYCACEICCGQWANGYTASGTYATQGRTIACSILPFGTEVYIEGLGTYIVEDTGVDGEWIDIFFDSHEEASDYGLQIHAIYLIN